MDKGERGVPRPHTGKVTTEDQSESKKESTETQLTAEKKQRIFS